MKRIIVFIIFFTLLSSNLLGQIPSGYYDGTIGLSGSNLRAALRDITSNGHNKSTYANLWNFYAITDVRPAPNNTIVWDMYSDIPGGTPAYFFTIFTNQCGTASGEGDCYSREHCMPNSWWGGYDDAAHPQYTDLHHLFPADQYVNGYKSAHPIGQVGTPTYTSSNGSRVGPCSFSGYTGVVFEPINEYKGDFARAYLYLATRYMDSLGTWVKNFPATEAKYVIDTATNNYKQWFINMLISWHNADTVSTKEINRNNNIFYNTIQENRNPFVDHPEYVQAIWGTTIIKAEPTNYATNFQASNTAPTHSSINVTWTDATGTVTPDGYLICASSVGFNQILNPTDSIVETNSTMQKMVYQGVQTVYFTGLTPSTIYYFKIFPYTNSGININYKTSGTVPNASDTTADLVWKEDFETGSKSSYTSGSVNCTMGSWTFSDALIGTSVTDRKNGLQSARLQTADLYMNFDKTDGADTVKIYHAKYGNDANSAWKLQISTDGGLSWNDFGSPVNTISTTLTPAIFVVKQQGNVRFNINKTSSIRINIDDITISNYVGGELPCPTLIADVSNNNVDNNIDISFIDDTNWRNAITAVKISNTVLTPNTDYVFSAGNLQLKPSGGNTLLTTAGSKSISIEATGYSTDTITQIINAGNPTTNSTATINSPLALNSSRTITCTAKDQYNNLVSGYTFKYDLIVTNIDTSTTETYTIDGALHTSNTSDINLSSTTNASGISTFTAAIPATIDPNDGLNIQVQLSNGTTNIVSAFSYIQQPSQITLIGVDPTTLSFQKSSANNILYRIKVDVTINSNILNGLSASSGGNYISSDITTNGLKLWYSADSIFGSDVNIASLSSLSTGSGETISFPGLNQTFALGTAYLFITADISATANAGNAISCNTTSTSNFTFNSLPTYSGNSFSSANLHSIVDNTGPTTLQAGDIAFVAYQYDDPDFFEFILLKDLSANTTINFTDNAWDGSALKTTEGSATWIAPIGGLTIGTLIKIQGTTVTGGGSVSINNMSFSVSGDQIIAYQGSSSSPTFIAAISSNQFISTGITASTTSYLPTVLTNKITANSFSTEVDNGYYNGTTVGTIDFLGASINNPLNWLTSNTIQTIPSPWTFSNSSSIIINQNITVQNLTIASNESITVNNGDTLTVNGLLTIKSDSNGTGSIIERNGIIATIERYIPTPEEFHIFASPVAAQAISSIVTAEDSLYIWNELTGSWVSYNDNNFTTINGGTNFVPGKGYAVSCPSVITKSLTGNLNHGTVNIPLTVSSGTYSGWNFIANPYPSSINWNSPYGFSRSNLQDTGIGEKAIWIWNPTSGNYGTFISNGVGTNGVSRNIPPAQGFWVKASTAGIFSINDSAREHSTQAWLKTAETNSNIIRVKVTSNINNFSDETIISYGKQTDKNGAEKLFSINETAPNLFTTKLNKKWSINYLTTIAEHPVVPLGLKVGKNGIYNLTFNGIEQYNQVILEDLKTGNQINIKSNNNYQFAAQKTDNPNRFLLHFYLESNSINENSNAKTNIYSYNKDIYINTTETIKEITVYNLLGQQIKKIVSCQNRIKFNIENASTYYIIKVVTDKNVYSQKVFIE